MQRPAVCYLNSSQGRCDRIVAHVTRDLNEFRKEVSAELAELNSEFIATCLELVSDQRLFAGPGTPRFAVVSEQRWDARSPSASKYD